MKVTFTDYQASANPLDGTEIDKCHRDHQQPILGAQAALNEATQER